MSLSSMRVGYHVNSYLCLQICLDGVDNASVKKTVKRQEDSWASLNMETEFHTNKAVLWFAGSPRWPWVRVFSLGVSLRLVDLVLRLSIRANQ